MARRTGLVKSVMTSQATYYLTPLASTLNYINKIENAFLWSSKNTTIGAKCKVNWETVCRSKKLGGFGVCTWESMLPPFLFDGRGLNGQVPRKNWWEAEILALRRDMDIFYVAMTITHGYHFRK
jgi:hypothetical protein